VNRKHPQSGRYRDRMVTFEQFSVPTTLTIKLQRVITTTVSRGAMPQTVQVGTILLKEWPEVTRILDLESEPCSGEWSLLKILGGFTLDHKIHAAGWNFFFMAAEVKVMFFGSPGTAKIQNALKRILQKVKPQRFNSLEVTGIVAKRFLGVPYVSVSAHSRHLQQSCYLDSVEARQATQLGAEWARG
jgi:hypothetical protein